MLVIDLHQETSVKLSNSKISRAFGNSEFAENGSSVISFLPYLFGCLLFLSFFVEMGTYIYINVAVDNAAFLATHELTQDINASRSDLIKIVENSAPALATTGQIEINKLVRTVDPSYYDHHLPAQKVIDVTGTGNWQNREDSNAPYNICSVTVKYKYKPRTAIGYGLVGATGQDILVSSAYTGITDATLAGNGDVSKW